MTWAYRIVKCDHQYQIHEVYFDENSKPEGFSKKPVFPRGDTIEDFKADLKRYAEAIEHTAYRVLDDELIAIKNRTT